MKIALRTGFLAPACLLVAALLTACGGGGGGSDAGAQPPSVSSATVGTPVLGQTLLITLQGANLDQGITVASAGCTGMARSTTAPTASTATTAYYTCTASVVGAQQVTVVRSSDNLSLATASYTVPPAAAALPTVTSTTAAPAKYSQSMLITIQGSNLDQALTVSSAGCKNMARSTTAPNVSTATTAYYTCTVSGVGAQTVAVSRSDGVALTGTSYTIAVPQVTLVISNTGVVQPVLVITLEAAKAPITTTNFLTYVNAGFYTGVVFHRYVPGFIVQAGGYAGPLVAGGTVPTLKSTNANITLEDNVGLSNTLMTLSMARTNVPDSANSQFFVNLANNTGLDAAGGARGYAVFGTITSGSGLLTTMLTGGCSAWPAFFGAGDSTACLPSPNITIVSATQTQ